MNPLSLLQSYNAPLARIVSLASDHKAATAEASKANKARGGKLADAIREYATATHDDGVPVADARSALRIALESVRDADDKPVIPAGTVKGYGASFAGYRDALADGEPIADMAPKAAQERVASPEVKALNAARKALREALKPLKADALLELAELAKAMAPEDKSEGEPATPTAEESEESADADAEPAVANG